MLLSIFNFQCVIKIFLDIFREINRDIMPIRIRHRDKNGTSTQQPDITPVSHETVLYSQASYTAIEILFGDYTDRYKQCYAYCQNKIPTNQQQWPTDGIYLLQGYFDFRGQV